MRNSVTLIYKQRTLPFEVETFFLLDVSSELKCTIYSDENFHDVPSFSFTSVGANLHLRKQNKRALGVDLHFNKHPVLKRVMSWILQHVYR